MKLDLPIQRRSATVQRANYDAKTRTVPVVWSTGAAVVRGGFFTEPYIEVLDMSPGCIRMGRLESGTAPVLNTHSADDLCDVIGVVDSAALADGEGTAMLRFSKRDDVSPILQDIEDGIIGNVSTGYRVYKAVREPKVEGETMPTIRCVDWEPMEISMVPIGADPGASTRNASPTVCELEDPQETPATAPGPALLRLQLEIEKEYL